MNKAELINAMAAESGLSKVDSKKALEAFFSSVTKALSAGDKISLVGFGTFSVEWESILLPRRQLRFLQRKLLNLNRVLS